MSINHPKKILIVDDEEDILTSLSIILRLANYAVIFASSGRVAIELARKELPDLIILDVLLHDIDGGSIVNILLEEPTIANIPILFLTGILRNKEDLLIKKEGSGKRGSHFIMAKPVSKEELLEMISKILTA